MVQTGSAQREPSMEEILASIRRIIEDSDTRQPDDAPAVAVSDTDDAELTESGEQHEVEAFRVELDEVGGGSAAAPVSMADIQASLPRHEAQAAEVEETATVADIRPFRGEPFSHAPAAGTVADEISPMQADEPRFDAVADADDDVSPAPAPRQEVDPRPALISDQAGRQVAAAFGELSEAFAASRRRSFDEMAEEMLRPMLQDWLDNNLPTLVEKLVREEIERVARGSQG